MASRSAPAPCEFRLIAALHSLPTRAVLYVAGRYAQSYLCITMDGEMLEKVADALVIAHQLITDHDTKSAKNEFPKLDRLATTRFPRAPSAPAIRMHRRLTRADMTALS